MKDILPEMITKFTDIEVDISSVTETDLSALADLYQQLIPSDFSVGKMRAVLDKHRSNPNHIVLAARIDGKLVGSLLAVVCDMLFGQCKSFMVVEDVVVDANHRREGVGCALMAYIEDYARESNCSYIMLVTDADRAGSQRFYKSLGYKNEEYCAFKKSL